MHRGEPDRLVGARMNVPLIVGLGDGEAFLASDVAAILAHTNRVVFLEEGDVVDLRPGAAARSPASTGTPRERAVHAIDWTTEAAEKGGFAHFMLKEIHEQPRGAPRSASPGGCVPATASALDELDPVRDALADASTASSSSPAAPRPTRASSAPQLVQEWTGLPARVTVGSEFRYSPPPLDARTLVIAVTQSGRDGRHDRADAARPRAAAARSSP